MAFCSGIGNWSRRDWYKNKYIVLGWSNYWLSGSFFLSLLVKMGGINDYELDGV